MDNIKERIISIVRSLDRPGKAAILNYLEQSNYFTCPCYGHHKERGGLARHSLEVYEHMRKFASGIPTDSMIVAALFHDLGKTRSSDWRKHGVHSLEILDTCGFELTPDERFAIGKHHDTSLTSYACFLRVILSWGDCDSTGRWKRKHPQ